MSELSFGEKAVKSTSVCPDAQTEELLTNMRKRFACIIDELEGWKDFYCERDERNVCYTAIQHVQTAQIWASKAIAQRNQK